MEVKYGGHPVYVYFDILQEFKFFEFDISQGSLVSALLKWQLAIRNIFKRCQNHCFPVVVFF